MKLPTILLWIARVWGAVVIGIIVIALTRSNPELPALGEEFKDTVLKLGVPLGLLLAYKWEGIGGLIALLAVLVSGFVHPIVITPGILYLVYALLRYREKSRKLN